MEESPSTSSQSVAAVEVSDEADDVSGFTFDPELDFCGGTQGALGRFAEDWLLSLDRNTIVSLSLFLTYIVTAILNLFNNFVQCFICFLLTCLKLFLYEVSMIHRIYI